MRRFDAVLFDLDGTLVHSSPGIFEGHIYTCARFGLDVSGRDLSPYLGPPLRSNFLNLLGDAEQADRAVEIYREHYDKVGRHMCEPYPGIRELLQKLKEEGLTLGIATCKVWDVARAVAEEKELAPFFSYVGGATHDGTIETKTEVIRSVLEQEAFRGKRVLMVGDREGDILGAKDCGLVSAGVLYGYGSLEELTQAGADRLAEDAAGLEKICLEEE